MSTRKDRYLTSIKNIENKTINDVNSLISKQNQNHNVNFVEEITSMNKEAYEEMEKLLNSSLLS